LERKNLIGVGQFRRRHRVNSSNPLAYFYDQTFISSKERANKQLRDLKEADRLASVAPQHHRRVLRLCHTSIPTCTGGWDLAYDQSDLRSLIELANELVAMESIGRRLSPVLMDRGNAFRAKGNFDRHLSITIRRLHSTQRTPGLTSIVLSCGKKKADATRLCEITQKAIRLDPKMWQAHFNRAISFREAANLAKRSKTCLRS